MISDDEDCYFFCYHLLLGVGDRNSQRSRTSQIRKTGVTVSGYPSPWLATTSKLKVGSPTGDVCVDGCRPWYKNYKSVEP